MTVHLARAFLDLLWLTGTLNWGQISNSDPRTKTEASSSSIPLWQCIAVVWNRTAEGEISLQKLEKVHATLAWQTVIWTYTISLRSTNTHLHKIYNNCITLPLTLNGTSYCRLFIHLLLPNSLIPRPSVGRRKGLVHTVCACIIFPVNTGN